MKPSETRKFGRNNFSVTAFAFGTAPLGNFLQEVSEEDANQMIQHAWDAGSTYTIRLRCMVMGWRN